MIRQDFFGCVNNVEGSLVMISTKALNKMLGSKDFELKNGMDEAETFVKKIIDAGNFLPDNMMIKMLLPVAINGNYL